MALWPENDQLAVLASATLPERKQVAETGIHSSERSSDLSNGASNPQFLTYRKNEKEKTET